MSWPCSLTCYTGMTLHETEATSTVHFKGGRGRGDENMEATHWFLPLYTSIIRELGSSAPALISGSSFMLFHPSGIHFLTLLLVNFYAFFRS